MALVALVGCRDDKILEPSNIDLYIEQKEFNVNPSGEIIHVIIKNSKVKPECEISENAIDWIQLYSWGGVDAGDTGEYTFIYKVLANDGYEAIRNGSIRVTSGSVSDVVNIHQSGGSPFAFIKDRQLSINADGGVLTINPKTNFNPTNIQDVSASWLSFEKTAIDAQDGKTKQIQFVISANDTGSDRSVDILYEDNETGQQDKFTILQGCRIVSSSKELVLNEDKQDVTLTIDTSLDLETNIEESWLVADVNGKLSIQALPEGQNEREAIVKYTNKSNQISEEVKVTQVRALRILGNDKDVKSLSLIPDCPYQLLAGTSLLTKDEEIIWSSSNETVVTVSANGLITPKSVGNAVITLTAGIYEKTCKIIIKERKDLLPMKYEGNYVFTMGSHEYDGQFELTNNSSYVLTVNSVASTSYNQKTEPGEKFVCPYKITYKGDGATGYKINWKMKVGSTSINFDTTILAGSLIY